MRFSEFKKLDRIEKMMRMTKNRKFDTLWKNFFKEAKEEGIEIPENDMRFKACFKAWKLYSLAEDPDLMAKFLKFRIQVDVDNISIQKATLEYARLWPDIFFGFWRASPKSDFRPGLIPILMQNCFEDPLEAFLVRTDLSNMTYQSAARKFCNEVGKKDSKEFLTEQKKIAGLMKARVRHWDR